jgi:hypothetical protein
MTAQARGRRINGAIGSADRQEFVGRTTRDLGGANVCLWHKADIQRPPGNVRFRGQSGHRVFRVSCLVLTLSGHRP